MLDYIHFENDPANIVTVANTTATMTIPFPINRNPRHRIMLRSDVWGGVAPDVDFATVSIVSRGQTKRLGIIKGDTDFLVNGPMESIVVVATRFAAGTATAIRCTLASAKDSTDRDVQTARARAVIAGNTVTNLSLPAGTDQLDAQHYISIASNVWSAGSSVSVTIFDTINVQRLLISLTADGYFPAVLPWTGPLSGIRITPAGSGGNQVYYVETIHTVRA